MGRLPKIKSFHSTFYGGGGGGGKNKKKKIFQNTTLS